MSEELKLDEPISMVFKDDDLIDPDTGAGKGGALPNTSAKDAGESEESLTNEPAKTITNPFGKDNEELAQEYGTTADVISKAKSMGWSGKENWRGNPKDFKGPADFVKFAEESNSVMRERYNKMHSELTEVKKMVPFVLDMQKQELNTRISTLEKDNARLLKELDQAKLLADAEAASKITEEIFENKLQKALALNEKKDLDSGKNKLLDITVAPENQDLEAEKAFRDTMLPRMTIEQKQKWVEAVNFLEHPINATASTPERISYMKKAVFNIDVPAGTVVSPVGKPSGQVFDNQSNNDSPTSVWDSMSKEEQKAALEIIEEVSWFKTRDTNPESKKEFDKYKQGFQKYKEVK